MNHNPADGLEADILVVDDMPDNIRFLSTLLGEQGYGVRKALNGQMALTAVKAALPDLILLDITMPGMNGYEVCQQLKADPETEGIPVIFLSALDDVLDKVRAFRLGAVDYITKPFQFEEVLARLNTQLALKKLQTQLKQQNKKLTQALQELKQAQTELIQREKMVGLGNLVAGVTHEINNPINFISGNLQPARDYMHALLDLVQRYQQECPHPSAFLQEAIEQVDLPYLAADLPKLMDSMQAGADRIRSIVLALRIFSRLGEAELKSVNLHEGLESTLLLLQHRLKGDQTRPDIKVIRNYGNLPMVTCYASQLNQVFLNLLTNAIDAIDVMMANGKVDAGNQAFVEPAIPEISSRAGDHPMPPYTIVIQTQLMPDAKVQIGIRDNGVGIPEAMQAHLFDPFFTTKPVGQGLGLGLATSYQIIERHGGRLICQSQPDRGTEFMIEIPLSQNGSDFQENQLAG
ncbi:hybrid sensor histidine kinase/response regulator [Leptolyngbya sp. 'hensonii']|uniref:hybrid sensor histidine kinase/response regulator n=1 Tax=Leptolyngbya sp. 'hensonii' TaxID=1922337 RepID=UPI000950133A|nr:response regulator [Leptolyngbya sp. 'hensonii']OLP18411.1 hybrid sensor histidine kinase/response regulator [Leptolyngbya sp. 'hensonii']